MKHPDTGTSTVTQSHAGYGRRVSGMVAVSDDFINWIVKANAAYNSDTPIARAVGKDRSYVAKVRGGIRRRVGRDFVIRFSRWFAPQVTPEMIAASAGIDLNAVGEDMTLQTIQANKGAPGEGR